MEILRKITIKTAGNFTIARIKEVLQDVAGYTTQVKDGQSVQVPAPIVDGTVVDLIKVAGQCVNAKTGATDKGNYTKLSGTFYATDMTTGQLYQSGQCILPEFIGSQIGAAVLGANGGAVEFGFLIQARAKANAVTGYEFAVTPLMSPKPTQEQLRLLSLIDKSDSHALPAGAEQASLSGPASEGAPAAASADPAAAPAAPAAPAAKSAKSKP